MDLKKFNLAPLYEIDQEWALLTSGKKERFNTMTVSWGGMGLYGTNLLLQFT